MNLFMKSCVTFSSHIVRQFQFQPTLFQPFRTLLTCQLPLANPSLKSTSLLSRVLPLQPLGLPPVRTNIRKHFRRPNELKRIRRHGWYARMSSPSGRRVIMNRILKGRHVLTH